MRQSIEKANRGQYSNLSLNEMLFAQSYQQKGINNVNRNANYTAKLLPNLSLSHQLVQPDLLQGCLFCLSFHPEQNILAAARANFLQIWDYETPNGKLKENIKCHQEVVTTIEWLNSPEIIFYTSSLDKSIKLWKNYENVQTLSDHSDWIRSVTVSKSNKWMLSGCVSAGICGWDVETGSLQFRIEKSHSHPGFPELNTINSLKFASNSDDVFVSGARDGCVKIWDKRTGLSEAVQTIVAHQKKVNIAQFAFDNRQLLSAGRDNCIKMWDLRSYEDCISKPTKQTDSNVIQIYDKHKCDGYNVFTNFLNNENQIITGSEDKNVYIYDRESADVVSVLSGHSNVVHLVDVKNDSTIATTTIDNCIIHMWTPSLNPKVVLTEAPENKASGNHEVIEGLLQKYGDQILHLFHKYNFTLSCDGSATDYNFEQNSDLYEVIQNMARDFFQSNDPPSPSTRRPNS